MLKAPKSSSQVTRKDKRLFITTDGNWHVRVLSPYLLSITGHSKRNNRTGVLISDFFEPGSFVPDNNFSEIDAAGATSPFSARGNIRVASGSILKTLWIATPRSIATDGNVEELTWTGCMLNHDEPICSSQLDQTLPLSYEHGMSSWQEQHPFRGLEYSGGSKAVYNSRAVHFAKNVVDAIIETDLSFVIISWNKAAEEIYGLMAEQVLGKSITFIKYGYYDDTEESAKYHLLKYGSWQGEITFDRLDGSRVHLSSSVSFLKNQYGDITGVVAVNRDITGRKKTETELIESETRFRLLSQNANELVCLHMPNCSVTFVSISVQNILGFSIEDFHGKSFTDFIHKQDQEGFLAEFNKTVSLRIAALVQFRIVNKNGNYLWLETVIQPVVDPGSGALIVQTNSKNITARKIAQLEMRRKEFEFLTLAENAPSIIVRFDEKLRFTFCNLMFEKVTMVSCEAILGKSAAESGLTGIPLIKLEKALRNVFSTRVKESITLDILRKNGSRLYLLSTIVPECDDTGRVKSLLMISSDITELKKKETQIKAKDEELLMSNERFILATKATTDALWEVNLQNGMRYASEEFITRFGYSLEELSKAEGDWYISRIHEDDRERVISKLYKAFSNRDPFWKDEFRWMCKDGSYKYILNQASVFYNVNGSPYRGIGAVQDVSKRKTDEAELLQKDKLLAAVAKASQELIIQSDIEKSVSSSLATMGQAAEVDGIIIYRLADESPQPDSYAKRKFEWHSDSVQPPCRNRLSQISVEHSSEVINVLKRGEIYSGLVKNLGNEWLRTAMSSENVQSVLLLPLFANGNLWGAISYRQCTSERQWTATETDIFKTFGSTLAATIQRNEALENLKNSEERFKALSQNSLDTVFVVNANCRISYVTPGVEKVLGYTEGCVLGKIGFEYIHPDDLQMIMEEFHHCLQDEKYNALVSVRVRALDDKWIWMEAKGQNKLRNPLINGIIVSFRDVTERHLAQQTLTEYSETITGILNSITDGFIAVDEHFTVTLWNQVAEKLIGLSKKDIIGKNLLEHLPGFIHSSIHKRLKDALYNKHTVIIEQHITALDKWFEGSVYPYEGGLFIYFKDVTIRKKQEMLLALEKTVLELNSELKTSLKKTVDTLLKGLESISSHLYCSVLIQGERGNTITQLSAPRLPDTYTSKINAVCVGPKTGTCVTAMFKKQRVIVSDIATDPLWDDFREAALLHDLKACWSIPIINAHDEVTASLACYYKEAKAPTPEDLSLMERAGNLLKIIIENKRAEEKMRISNDRYLLATRATRQAIWDLDITTYFLYWGEGLYSLFGYTADYKNNTLRFWEKHIHPDDREKVIKSMNDFIKRKDRGLWTEEYRFKKSDGNYLIVIDKGYLIFDKKQEVLRMVGAMEDVTEKKRIEKKLIKHEVEKQRLVAQAVVDAQEKERAKVGKELHDNVNQILSTSKLFLEVAKTNAKDRLKLIGRSAEEIHHAINEIRHISQSLVPPNISDIGLSESIKDLVEDIAVAKTLNVEYHNIGDIENNISENQKLTLFRIIQEQVNNVLKHAEARHLSIRLLVDNTKIELCITDDGKGFDPEKVRTKKGVGISNIYSRVELCNGKVKLVTAPGKGCKLIVKVQRIANNKIDK